MSTEHSLSSNTGWHNPLPRQLQDVSLGLCGGGGGAAGRKKGSQCQGLGGVCLPFCGTTEGGGLNVARKLTSCPATAAAAATSHPGWRRSDSPQPQRGWWEISCCSLLHFFVNVWLFSESLLANECVCVTFRMWWCVLDPLVRLTNALTVRRPAVIRSCPLHDHIFGQAWPASFVWSLYFPRV